MYSRSIPHLVFLFLLPLLGSTFSGLLVTSEGLVPFVDTDLIEEQNWWTSDRARFVILGLLLSVGGCLIWVTILRRRIQAQIQTIQFYEEEVSIVEERLKTAQRSKSYLFTSISNEIKSPLDDVLSYTTLLEDTVYGESQQDYINSIRNRGFTLRGVVDDLMDFSLIEAGQLEIKKEPFVLQQCIKDAIGMVLSRAVEKELELSYSIESGVPRAIISDSKRVKQVLANLLNNGIKFTERGSVSIHVSRNQESRELELLFTVKDTGIGIQADQLETISRTLSLTDSADDFSGVGLGLAMCRCLIRLLGGKIWVESNLGSGSTFKFLLPVEESHIEMPAPVPPVPATAAIGLVDQNRITRKIAAKFFSRLGHTVNEFNSIESLLISLEATSYQLLFVDINEVETPNLMQAIMDLTHVAKDTPIIVITESNTGENVAALKAMGVNRVISKPIQLKDLSAIVQGIPSLAQS